MVKLVRVSITKRVVTNRSAGPVNKFDVVDQIKRQAMGSGLAEVPREGEQRFRLELL